MTPDEFAKLAAEGYNRIPVVEEVLADLDTPLSTYLKLAGGPYSYLLESAHGGEKWGRYSIIGLPARTVLKVAAKRHHRHDRRQGRRTSAIATIRSRSSKTSWRDIASRRSPGLPRFYGGLVGYFGYDTVRYVEKRLAHSAPPDLLGTPDILLMVSNDVIVFDNLKGRSCRSSRWPIPRSPDALTRATRTSAARSHGVSPGRFRTSPTSSANQPIEESDFTSEFGREAFMAADREDPRVHRRRRRHAGGAGATHVGSVQRRRRSTCIARCAASIRRRTCTTWTSTTFTS